MLQWSHLTHSTLKPSQPFATRSAALQKLWEDTLINTFESTGRKWKEIAKAVRGTQKELQSYYHWREARIMKEGNADNKRRRKMQTNDCADPSLEEMDTREEEEEVTEAGSDNRDWDAISCAHSEDRLLNENLLDSVAESVSSFGDMLLHAVHFVHLPRGEGGGERGRGGSGGGVDALLLLGGGDGTSCISGNVINTKRSEGAQKLDEKDISRGWRMQEGGRDPGILPYLWK